MKLTTAEKKLLASLVYAEHIRLMNGIVDVNKKDTLLKLWIKLGGK